ncbi:MAG: chloride channel protein [Chloroflexi bacterium]|nr:chloride channel protein [Chloroflexota bacterium]
MGAVVELATALFLLVEHWLVELLWEEIPHQLGGFRFYTLLICTLGGLLVGLGQHFLGDWPKPMKEALEDVRTNGEFDVAHVPHGVVISLVSLSFGGALGPEAALIGLAGGLGTYISRQLKMSAQQAYALTYFSVSGALGAFFRSPLGSAALPLESDDGTELPRTWTMIPGIFAGLAGLLVTITLAGDTLGVTYDFLPYAAPRNGTDLLIAIPFGLLGGLLGAGFLWVHDQLHHRVPSQISSKIVRGLLGGLLLGLLGTFSSLVLFSGQTGMNDLFTKGAEMGGWLLIVIGLAKLLAVALLVTTGWKGGEFFPMMFAGAAIGMGVAYLIPSVDPMVGAMATMAATTAAMLRKPLAVVLLVVLLMPASLLVPITVGAYVGTAVTMPRTSNK